MSGKIKWHGSDGWCYKVYYNNIAVGGPTTSLIPRTMDIEKFKSDGDAIIDRITVIEW